jgi:hypothetical protein
MPKVTKVWEHFGTYYSAEEAFAALNAFDEDEERRICERPFRKKNNASGEKQFFRCKHAVHFSCKFEVQLHFPWESSAVHLFTSSGHEHSDEDRRSAGSAGILTPEQRSVVEDGVALHLTPTNIARMMERKGCGIPPGRHAKRSYIRAIQNRCSRERRKARGGKNVDSWDSGDMAAFCEENKFDTDRISEHPNQMFVADNDCTN